MKKSSFTALVLGTVSSILFALGMCMVLLPEWDAFVPGIVLGSIGLVFGIVTVFVWRKMTNKTPLRLSGKAVLAILLSVFGALVLGLGMCLCMVWDMLVWGIIVGIVGILLLLALIPLLAGLKD